MWRSLLGSYSFLCERCGTFLLNIFLSLSFVYFASVQKLLMNVILLLVYFKVIQLQEPVEMQPLLRFLPVPEIIRMSPDRQIFLLNG